MEVWIEIKYIYILNVHFLIKSFSFQEAVKMDKFPMIQDGSLKEFVSQLVSIFNQNNY